MEFFCETLHASFVFGHKLPCSTDKILLILRKIIPAKEYKKILCFGPYLRFIEKIKKPCYN